MRTRHNVFWIPNCRFGLELLEYSKIIRSKFFNQFLHLGVLRVNHKVLALWFLDHPLLIWLTAALIFQNYKIVILKSIFVSWRLKGRPWGLFWIPHCLFKLRIHTFLQFIFKMVQNGVHVYKKIILYFKLYTGVLNGLQKWHQIIFI